MLVVAFSDNYVMVYKKGRLQQRKFTSYRDYGRPDAVLTDFFSRIYLIKVSHLPHQGWSSTSSKLVIYPVKVGHLPYQGNIGHV